MKRLTAKDALSDTVIAVTVEMRPGDVRKAAENSHATHVVVFDGPDFRGIVPLHELGFSKTERIFADLIPLKPVPNVSEDATLDHVGGLLESDASDIVIVKRIDGRYLGLITQQSLLKAFLSHSRRHSAEQAQAAEERFQELLESAPDAMLIIDAAGTIVQVNRQAAKLFGYEVAELTGALIEVLVPSDLRERHVAHRDDYFADPSRRPMGVGLELRGVRKNGTEFFVEVSINPLVGDHGLLAVAAIRDVSKRKENEDLLRESEERFRQLAENIQEVFWIIDKRTASLGYVSPAYEKIWKRSCESVYQNIDSFLDAIHPDDRASVIDATAKQAKGQCTDQEYRVIQPDGTVRWVRDRGFPIFDARGDVYRIVGVAEDITESRTASVMLEEMNLRLQDALDKVQRTQAQVIQQERLRALGQMASGIAHDLNNTLSPVLAYAELLASAEDLPENLRAFSRHIETAGRDAAVVVDRLREFYRPGNADHLHEVLNLSRLMRQIPELTRPK